MHEGFKNTEVIINCKEATEDIHKIVSMLQNFDNRLLGIKNGQTFTIYSQDVLYFESVDKKTFIYTADDVYECKNKLYEIEAKFSDTNFFRSSKSQIINIAKIKSLCPEFGGRMEVILDSGEKLIVSRQYTKTFKERLGLK